MHAVILAAGLGSRLAADRPKPCVVVAGKALLQWTIDFARAAGADRVVVVVGYEAGRVAALADACGADAIVRNEEYASAGNLRSLFAARAELHAPFLVTNADHVYRDGIARIVADVAAQAAEVTAFVDRDRTLGVDDMKVQLDDRGRVAAIAKTLASWDVGYVGMTFVPRACAARYFAAAEETAAAVGRAAHVESVLGHLASRGDSPAVRDVSGVGWFEVDDASDWAAAEEGLR